jgi:hypothetical protein
MAKENEDAKASFWRTRAAELRIEADAIKDAEARTTLLRIAQQYDRLAERAAAKNRDPGVG